jgi:hypothetical protein
MEECSPLGIQDTNHNPRDVEISNLSTCPSCTLCYLSLDLSMFQEVLESQIWHPPKKHKMEILTMVIKQCRTSGNEIQMPLED